jgi:serine/threonine protein kinase
MSVRFIPCGEFVNASERTAVERLRAKLQSVEAFWILLSNLNHSAQPGSRSDEIDLIAIGPPGIYAIEIKHWDAAYLRQQALIAEPEAERINAKAKRIAGQLRRHFDPGFVTARLLVTRGELRLETAGKPRSLLRGVAVFGLPEWRELLTVDGPTRLTPAQVEQAAQLLEPTVKVALNGELRTFAGLIHLERLADPADTFHRRYRGQHPTRRDRVILHLYDLSASADKQPLELARREFDTLQRWQKSPFVPSLLDSFQDADGYPGELCFFSLVDPAAPTLTQRAQDTTWDTPARLAFAGEAIRALAGFHHPDQPDQPPLLHRRITPASLRVRHNNRPLFTDFSLSRLTDSPSISAMAVDFGAMTAYVAPELLTGGLAAATPPADVYALCATLVTLFSGDDPLAGKAREVLARGGRSQPAERATLAELATALDELQGVAPPAPDLPAPDYWDEDTVVPFQNSRYKILNRLGSGGIGQTFKVVELDIHSDERFGAYVAKTVLHQEDGEAALRAYRQVRAQTTHPNLSTIHEIAPEWRANGFVALLKWIEGMPLQDLIGVLPLYAEDLGESSAEALAVRWLLELCAGLGELHQHGLAHGDVSPRNIIVQGGTVVLTDYDKASTAGGLSRGGTPGYASPGVQNRATLHPADDVYALAASFFHLLFDREPVRSGPEQGLNGQGLTGYERLRPFLERATHPQPEQRFADATVARQFLWGLRADDGNAGLFACSPEPAVPLTPNTALWLNNLLSAYPGSRHGNSETRGLDSKFAVETYVETRLDSTLLAEIEAGQVNLAILFGNAGDGKTAFLQYLARKLGVEEVHSSRRIWECRLANGRVLRVNLDGSAAWQGRSANELLDELFAPFQQPDYSRENVHIVAINSGKLLEWIESHDQGTTLTRQLRQVLLDEPVQLDSGFRLIDLNQRSLVGGVEGASKQITTAFLNALLDRLLGVQADEWQSCQTCSAQSRCTAWHSVQTLRNAESGPRLRSRLTDALQACHQRGEVHITARELRAALSYILFGVHDCAELHENPELCPPRYYQRAFDAHAPQRQGELLAELVRFDPALEANPALDRQLLKDAPAHSLNRLAEVRRRAYFEQPDAVIPLADGRHLDRFRNAPLSSAEELDALGRELCLGMARLEDLPPIAFNSRYLERGAPLRITPRTPIESAFWVVKPWGRFSLEAPLPDSAEGLETLHTHLRLIYRYGNGSTEALLINLELFQRLMELKSGVQISGIAQEGVFANLKIFTQRLAREDARELYGWHPAEEEQVFRLRVELQNGRQTLIREML